MKKGINNPGFRALPSSVQNNILSNMRYGGKKYAAGGAMPMEQLTEFDEGGRHEENSLGGIPQGMNPEGQMNLVEEGETKFDAENYIYSDSLKVDKELAEAFNLNPKMVGKTFADASKMAGRKKSKREGDAIEMAANEKDLMNLMEAQEAFKQARIEEKLQEIAELDPNALPALMGQGQPQGDPAMGGQMQEAPMDEQAMMEQQMMAEQQAGGGQPSPEEMAMMEQQQNQMMGQQEGMMRAGGTMDFEPHMMYKDSNGIQANTYEKHLSLKNEGYGHSMGYGGYTKKRSYAPGGFMGMNMANAGMMAPGPCGTPGNPPCPGKETEISTVNVDRNTATSGTGGLGSIKFDSNLGFGEADSDIQALEQDLRQSMLSNQGAYVSTPPPAELGKLTRRQERTGEFVKGTFVPGNTIAENIAERRENRKDFRQKPNTAGRRYTKVNRLLNPFRASDNRIENTGNQYFALKHPRATEDAEGNSLRGLSNLFLGVKDNSKFVGRFGEGKIKSGGGTRFRRNEFGGNLMQPEQPMQMRRGGKMCYGCGGAMHNYGGRMDGIQPNQAKYGKWLDFTSNVLGAGASAIGNIPLIGQAIGAGLGTLSGVTGSLAENARTSEDGKVNWQGIDYGDMALQAGMGAGAGALGAAGSVLTAAGGKGVDALTTSKYEKKEAMFQDILTNPEKYSEEQYEQALGRQQEMGKNSGLFNAINAGVGIAGSIAGGKIDKAGEAAVKGAEVATDVAKTADTVISASDNILPEAFDQASAAVNAAKTADVASNFMTKANNVADNKFMQQGVSMGMDALDKVDQTNTQETVADELAVEQKRAAMMTNDPDSMYYDPINQPVNMATAGTGMMANGGYMGTRSYGTGGRPGLWANIQAKKKRMGSNYRPAQPGDPNRPTAEAIKASQNAMGGSLDYSANTYDNGGKLTLMKQVAQPDGTMVNRSVTYNSLQELLADSEIVQKYGGKENVKELFSERFKDSKIPFQKTMLDAPQTMANVDNMPSANLTPANAAQIDENLKMIEDQERMAYMQNQLQVSPDKLAELEAAKNLERTVDSENTVFQEDLNKNNMPDYLEQAENFSIEEDKEVEKKNKVKTKEEPVIEEDPNKIVKTDDIENTKFDFNYKESFPQFAAKYAAPLYNIGSGLLSKQKDYMPEFVPLETPKFDPTQAINNVKRQVSGLRKSLNKVGANPSNLLALAQSGSRLENETLMTYDKLQKELDFRGNQYNTTQKQSLKKYKKQLEMSFDEAKRKSIQEGIKQMGKIQETESANYLAAQYNSMAAPNLGTFEYTPFLEGLLNKMNKKKNK